MCGASSSPSLRTRTRVVATGVDRVEGVEEVAVEPRMRGQWMGIRELARHDLGDMAAHYVIDDAGQVGLTLLPRHATATPHRDHIGDEPYVASNPDLGSPPALVIDPIVHLAIRGDHAANGFASGRTMRWSPSNARFSFDTQTIEADGTTSRVATVLRSPEGLRLTHLVSHRIGDTFLSISTEFSNGSQENATVDALSSFALSGLSPFDATDSANRLIVHRLRTSWSAEARPVADTIEGLHLERSWLGVARLSERFGQVGTMPTRGWFPFVAIEDTIANVTWGAQLAWAGSWQLEVARVGDDVALSGGLADREFGHWSHAVAPGQSLITPTAIVSCTAGSVDELTDRLVSAQVRSVEAQPEREQSLPIVFNEWCTTWGSPDRDRLAAIADRLAGEGIEYLVIDAGWYRNSSTSSWSDAHGDWVPSAALFPNGLGEVTALIRERGMVPGLWFEFETVGATSTAFSLVDRLLHRDGIPLTVGSRRFWDLTDPFVVDYLTEKVIDLLVINDFGYLKVDYNDTIGIGADNPDGLGEGLRQQVLATYRFFDRIRERMPHLVIENCASGGHRLEPSMMSRTAMSSFSDAHELPEIPIIAGNLLRAMLPRQMQIWAVLHAADSDQRLVYSLAAAFLGRMCISGDVLDLDAGQWQLVRQAIALYSDAAPTIRAGVSRRTGQWSASLRHPTGWQAVTRYSADGDAVLVVVHCFANAANSVELELHGDWQVTGTFFAGDKTVTVRDGFLGVEKLRDFDAIVVRLARAPTPEVAPHLRAQPPRSAR